MTKMILMFLIGFFLVFFGIEAFRKLTKKKKWRVIKTLTYSAICAIITMLIFTSIVILF
jgi:uncharacterized membrane protein YjfL (UPF0719 family)